jgi:hypothetical protein
MGDICLSGVHALGRKWSARLAGRKVEIEVEES